LEGPRKCRQGFNVVAFFAGIFADFDFFADFFVGFFAGICVCVVPLQGRAAAQGGGGYLRVLRSELDSELVPNTF
jgi:hypothetical protein